MSLFPVPSQTDEGLNQRGTVKRWAGSQWLALARMGWGGVTGLCLALFVAAVPVRFLQLSTPPVQLRLALRHLHLSVGFYATYNLVCEISLVVGFLTVAAVIFWRSWGKSNERLALFVALFLVTFGTDTPTLYALAEVGAGFAVLVKGVDALAWAFLGFFLSLFPNGRFVPGFTRWLVALNVVYQVFWLLPDHSPLFPPNWPPLLLIPLQLSLLACYLCVQIYRYWRVSGPLERQQTKWVVFGLAAAGWTLPFLTGSISPAHTQLDVFGVIGVPTLRAVWLFIPLSIGIAILRYRLWDIDIIINRTLVYGLLTASVIGSYVLVVGVLGILLQLQGNLLISLLATGLVAVLFQPLRTALQRAVNRLIYGERDEPYKVISRLGSRLEATLAPEEVLPAIVETVAHSLKLPYVAISLKQEDEFKIVASCGTEPGRGPGNVGAGLAPARLADALLHLPLTYQAETIGELILAPRVGSESFTGSERQLLNELARQAGIAVHGVLLTADLERSRQHIVAAREEARRQLGSDLHDGLGHMLTSVVRKVESTSLLLEQDTPAAQNVLLEIKQQTKNAIDTTRRLAHSLHPPELELLGLVQALSERVRQFDQPDGSELHVTVDAPPALPPLPIAVEAAAYYIALEAVNNVYRHAGARNCSLRLELLQKDESSPSLLDVWNTDVLTLEVCDDGSGLPEGEQRVGLGLSSMYERAAELGGACLIEKGPTSGTRVYVRLPCIQLSDARR